VKNIFLDSDVILDALLNRPEFRIAALNTLQLAVEKRLNCATSSTAFVNVHYFLNKYDRENKMELLKHFRSIISIIEVDETIIDQALESEFSDFEDAVQFFAAKKANVEVIVTRNVKDYKRSTIPVLTPEQFLRTL